MDYAPPTAAAAAVAARRVTFFCNDSRIYGQFFKGKLVISKLITKISAKINLKQPQRDLFVRGNSISIFLPLSVPAASSIIWASVTGVVAADSRNTRVREPRLMVAVCAAAVGLFTFEFGPDLRMRRRDSYLKPPHLSPSGQFSTRIRAVIAFKRALFTGLFSTSKLESFFESSFNHGLFFWRQLWFIT